MLNKNKVRIANFSFLKPVNFVEAPIYSKNSVKLVNYKKNIQVFISIFGRDGDFCKESYDLIFKNVSVDVNSKLKSKRVFKRNNLKIYNLFFKKGNHNESIYLTFKENKTFRFTFIFHSEFDNTLKIFEKLIKSLNSF